MGRDKAEEGRRPGEKKKGSGNLLYKLHRNSSRSRSTSLLSRVGTMLLGGSHCLQSPVSSAAPAHRVRHTREGTEEPARAPSTPSAARQGSRAALPFPNASPLPLLSILRRPREDHRARWEGGGRMAVSRRDPGSPQRRWAKNT